MAEDLRSYEEVLKELFFGKDAALDKCAKVRKTLYEISLWKKHGLPLAEVGSAEKAYFSRRFLSKQRIDKVSEFVLDKALESLGYAAGFDPNGNPVESGCRSRCYKLINELNIALAGDGFPTVDVERFLNYFTFDFDFVLDNDGKPKLEPGYDFEMRIFRSDANRLWFRMVLRALFLLKLRLSMQHVNEIAKFLHKHAKPRPSA
jgi:hypothetical protein